MTWKQQLEVLVLLQMYSIEENTETAPNIFIQTQTIEMFGGIMLPSFDKLVLSTNLEDDKSFCVCVFVQVWGFQRPCVCCCVCVTRGLWTKDLLSPLWIYMQPIYLVLGLRVHLCDSLQDCAVLQMESLTCRQTASLSEIKWGYKLAVCSLTTKFTEVIAVLQDLTSVFLT